MTVIDTGIGETYDLRGEEDRGVSSGDALQWRYYCKARVRPEDDGFVAYIPSLPGVVSEGGTVEEATANIQEALEGAIESYRVRRVPIPWTQETEPCGVGERSVRIAFDA